MMNKKNIVWLIAVALLVTACGGASRDEKKRLVVSIEPLRYITEQIAGDNYSVETLVPVGTSPETYDPTPMQMVNISSSPAFFRVGNLGFEQEFSARMATAYPSMTIVDASSGVDLFNDDPHIWCSPANALVMGRNIRDALCSIDSANAERYAANYRAFAQQVQQTDSTIRSIVEGKEGASFLIYHPALTYYARDYNLRQVCIEEEGKEPTPAQLKELIDSCKVRGVKTIFVQQEFDEENATTIARELNASIEVINPLSYHWSDEMISIAKSVK